jgi:hypothetical protein
MYLKLRTYKGHTSMLSATNRKLADNPVLLYALIMYKIYIVC